MTRLWIARAGKHGEYELEALSEGFAIIGFHEVGDLSRFRSRDEIVGHLQDAMPDAKTGAIRNYAAQLNQFANEIAKGDLIAIPRRLAAGIAFGRAEGDYTFQTGADNPHRRKVKWLEEAVPREKFKQDLRHSFGAAMTVCEIGRNNAVERVKAVLEGHPDPGPNLNRQGTGPAATPDTDASEEDYATDIEELANAQIVAMIRSEFAGHALAHLVAELLRLEGYKTKVSPPGPDGGVDILAAGGTLGLGEDRIVVEVKSHDGPANQDVVLKLLGAVDARGAQTGLLVSIGGVNGPAQKLLDEKFFKLRLWQMPELLDALFRNYHRLSPDTRGRLPLRQVWAPMQDSGE
jgi:restriction system protein